MRRVTWLEPRTPHQPGKLQKLSKNGFVLLLSFSESTQKAALYLLKNQSSAGRPQAGVALMVHFVEDLPAFSLTRPRFSQISSTCGEDWRATVQILRL
jgi:hypothetical protein